MDAADALAFLGGIASSGRIVDLSSRRKLRTAVGRGEVLAVGRDRYVLATATQGQRAAARLHGTSSHLDAALSWGWELKSPPGLPHVIVPRHRRLRPGQGRATVVHYADLAPSEVDGHRTAAVRTVLDCARSLEFDVALSVADSALRHGDVDPQELAAAAHGARGPGSGRIRKVARAADGRAANPFESVLRAIALEEGWRVAPQRELLVPGAVLRPDLVEEERGTVLEADSWTWHASREQHDRDCDRYNLLVAAGWRVLRFTWWQVMKDPGYVRGILREIDRPPGQAMGRDTPRSVA